MSDSTLKMVVKERKDDKILYKTKIKNCGDTVAKVCLCMH
jgi:hypothetical protein